MPIHPSIHHLSLFPVRGRRVLCNVTYSILQCCNTLLKRDLNVQNTSSQADGLKGGEQQYSVMIGRPRPTSSHLLKAAPMALSSILGPQLKTPLRSPNRQRLRPFHTSLSTQSGIKMWETECTIDFSTCFFFWEGAAPFLSPLQMQTAPSNQFTTLCCLRS